MRIKNRQKIISPNCSITKSDTGILYPTLMSLASLESAKDGYMSSYFCTACCALRASTHRWQREARKKYSFALYLSRELSRAEEATWENSH